ncbi:TatD family hydrolase [Candidatus Woesearchaeota archaeon]|nr:TatD family hydrolase [Candidatus Woesearchaeota archaeon]MBW2994037.1 TatD family hydrolase [Candidatus Woesearchaeota archaeon]
MNLVDVHCHLNHEKFNEDRDEVVQRAKDAGVKVIITSGVNVPTNREVLELAKKYDVVKCTLGIYPIDALNIKIDELDEVGLTRQAEPFDVDEELKFILSKKKEIMGIGECGMDFKYLKDHEKQQKINFQKVIDCAEKLKKPIVVHTRNAELECVEMLESSKLKKVILHSFGGRKTLMKRAADNGWSFSVPAVITRLQHFETLVSLVNINQLLTETDAPWLSPVKFQRNEPMNVLESIKQIAKIKKFNVEETADSVFLNYQRMF